MKIGLLGHGVVGSGVAKIIDASLTPETEKMEIAKILVHTEQEKTDPRCTTDVQEILNDPEIDTICECMGGKEPAHSYVRQALESGKHAVTSNKKMLASFLPELLAAAENHGVFLAFEATSGGGIPWMANLRRIRRIEPITSFRGIFNGTTNYILDRMKKEDMEFDAALSMAQQLGYAERDPSDDIDGWDTLYKTILSTAEGMHLLLSKEEIPCFGIRAIRKEDIAWAKENGRTIKLIGTSVKEAEGVDACVLPCALKNSDYFAEIALNLNAIESVSDTLGPAGFIGQGAGSLPTAHAVVQDLIDIEKGEAERLNGIQEAHIAAHAGVFYVRVHDPEVLADVCEKKINAHALLTKKMRLSDLKERLQKEEDAFVMEVQA